MDLGLSFRTWWRGQLVGEDEFGNRYYTDRRQKPGKNPRRWVIYKGQAEASKVPAEWHSWLHYTVDQPLLSQLKYSWEKSHQRNLTGTKYAYKPKGWGRGHKPAVAAEYEPWRPL